MNSQHDHHASRAGWQIWRKRAPVFIWAASEKNGDWIVPDDHGNSRECNVAEAARILGATKPPSTVPKPVVEWTDDELERWLIKQRGEPTYSQDIKAWKQWAGALEVCRYIHEETRFPWCIEGERPFLCAEDAARILGATKVKVTP
jgi:hypothetical protein